MDYKLYDAKDSKGKEIVLDLMQTYTKELSLYADETTHFTLLDNGLYHLGNYIDLYWEEENRYPYILKNNDKVVGFVLVRFNEENMYEIGEFFVKEEYRKLKAGTYMANEMFKRFHGKWEIRTLLKNKPAQEFWRKVVNEVSNGVFEEKLIRNNSRLAFYFEN